MDPVLIDCARDYLRIQLQLVNDRLFNENDEDVCPFDDAIRAEIIWCLKELDEIEDQIWFGGCTPTRSIVHHPSDELECYLQLVREVYGFTIPEQGG